MGWVICLVGFLDLLLSNISPLTNCCFWIGDNVSWEVGVRRDRWEYESKELRVLVESSF